MTAVVYRGICVGQAWGMRTNLLLAASTQQVHPNWVRLLLSFSPSVCLQSPSGVWLVHGSNRQPAYPTAHPAQCGQDSPAARVFALVVPSTATASRRRCVLAQRAWTAMLFGTGAAAWDNTLC